MKEFDIGLAQEYTQRRGKSLVRIYKYPMWNRYNCGASLRIQEGLFGLIMESLGSHNADSHLEHGETPKPDQLLYLLMRHQVQRISLEIVLCFLLDFHFRKNFDLAFDTLAQTI